jgi:hypothetical protein
MNRIVVPVEQLIKSSHADGRIQPKGSDAPAGIAENVGVSSVPRAAPAGLRAHSPGTLEKPQNA